MRFSSSQGLNISGDIDPLQMSANCTLQRHYRGNILLRGLKNRILFYCTMDNRVRCLKVFVLPLHVFVLDLISLFLYRLVFLLSLFLSVAISALLCLAILLIMEVNFEAFLVCILLVLGHRFHKIISSVLRYQFHLSCLLMLHIVFFLFHLILLGILCCNLLLIT